MKESGIGGNREEFTGRGCPEDEDVST